MGPSIHQRTIQEVKDKADIVEVISEHIVLKKKGKEFVGICPFHDDSKPSMTVSPAKQFYYCFSCGAGGNSIKFLRAVATDGHRLAQYDIPLPQGADEITGIIIPKKTRFKL